ncbi:MAG: hypothetical protein QOG20_1788 [Pseudonocardiales bacterium]|jgi:anti-anti-sigma factor|nr:hypothetical protein [Pseudonocardiales bacterium]MDT7706181.1 hypothetical protein [Pseudonocardiales bacterium]
MCSAPQPGHVRVEDVRPGIPLLAVMPGPLDRETSPRLDAALDHALDRHPWGVVLDLRDVSSLTSNGLAMLVRVATRAWELEIGLCLVCSPHVRAVVTDAGLHEVFDLHPGVAEALAALGVTNPHDPRPVLAGQDAPPRRPSPRPRTDRPREAP